MSTPLGTKPTAPWTFAPLTSENWSDLEQLFGERGACGGCWCMWWRLTQKEFEAAKGEANRNALQKLVKGRRKLGILAYRDRQPVGWCAVEPREAYPRFDRSRILKPVDDQRVWSVTCFFVHRSARRQGLSVALLEEVAAYVARHGGSVVEGYPVDKIDSPPAFAWTGTAAAFRSVGFREVARRSPTRPNYAQKG